MSGPDTAQPASAAATKRAVLYLRVSTPRQMHTAVDIDPEGNSIATQRETCLAKAHQLTAVVCSEFVEPGNSAQSIEKRPVFKQMLAYLEDHRDIDYVIVYTRSRAFRNSIDAAVTKRALSLLGIRIISCKEDFGTGYMADAMETVSDVFNELQVRQSGEDIEQENWPTRPSTAGRSPAPSSATSTSALNKTAGCSTPSASTRSAPR